MQDEWRFLFHAANAVAWYAALRQCPGGPAGTRCAVHSAIALGIELLRAREAWNDVTRA